MYATTVRPDCVEVISYKAITCDQRLHIRKQPAMPCLVFFGRICLVKVAWNIDFVGNKQPQWLDLLIFFDSNLQSRLMWQRMWDESRRSGREVSSSISSSALSNCSPSVDIKLRLPTLDKLECLVRRSDEQPSPDMACETHSPHFNSIHEKDLSDQGNRVSSRTAKQALKRIL